MKKVEELMNNNNKVCTKCNMHYPESVVHICAPLLRDSIKKSISSIANLFREENKSLLSQEDKSDSDKHSVLD
jgi:hypothetical protein